MRWLHSAAFDLSLFLGPPLLSVLGVLLWEPLRTGEVSPAAWLFLIVFIDVAHVYSSLYRVYLDRAEFSRRKALYLNVPLACLAAGILLHSQSPLAFWRVLAYVAVFHFVRQQWGFLRLYQRLEGSHSSFDETLDSLAIYSSMLYPLAFWHGDPGRVFAWFIPGDFISLPPLPALAGWAYALVLSCFFLRQIQRKASGFPVHWGKTGIVFATAASWYAGIVFFNSDMAFTVTNVVSHGVPYLALVWLYGRRKWASENPWFSALHRPALLALFLLPLLALAYFEEALWDLLVWHDHGALFGGLAPWEPGAWINLLVPLLALPQATHYVLDAWIWRFDGSNPGLDHYVLAP